MARSLATKCEHKDRLANARGLCMSCYGKWYKEHKGDHLARKKHNATKCKHTDRIMVAHGLCDSCYTEWRRENQLGYRIKGNASSRKSFLFKKYGLDDTTIQAMIQLQGGVCPICHQSFANVKPYIDHDHRTGANRGMLCQKCNTALGMVNDSVDSLLRAIKYLQSPPFNLFKDISDVREVEIR